MFEKRKGRLNDWFLGPNTLDALERSADFNKFVHEFVQFTNVCTDLCARICWICARICARIHKFVHEFVMHEFVMNLLTKS